MTAYDEYAAEKQTIEGLVANGYLIARVNELLDGAEAIFVKQGAEKEKVVLRTADARKHLSYLVIAQQNAAGKAQ
ncbi:hypothetical protein [Cohnella thailandensis]|uniref:Uncharacterized protein n=1 Tax=Cohnella thailandensis TaxID=557557 RepID=A0A841ST21_9BACL|nr:hypothetical protein [Cohnella thailandensis]MBB6634372.1 hypothetical protein [Cohnella thailandensis]MBP1972129.1 tRNA/tmRNA/rRNA uracil-C5-methylase (TrmA/RlmC/RlmD family) [Cohnella thailandensis]